MQEKERDKRIELVRAVVELHRQLKERVREAAEQVKKERSQR